MRPGCIKISKLFWIEWTEYNYGFKPGWHVNFVILPRRTGAREENLEGLFKFESTLRGDVMGKVGKNHNPAKTPISIDSAAK